MASAGHARPVLDAAAEIDVALTCCLVLELQTLIENSVSLPAN
jgi:hypothetical protein